MAAIAATAAVAVAPGPIFERIPYDASDLGEIATQTIKASRDLDVLDEATTRRMREEAVAAVRAVYVHDAALIDSVNARIRAGFEFARRVLAEAGEGDGLSALEAQREALEDLLGARLENHELEALARAGFAPEIEEGVVAMATQAMRELIVSDREELTQHRSRGIAIRRVSGDRVVTEILSDVEGIRDLATVRAQLGISVELASQPRPVRQAALELARRQIRSNLKYDPALTQERRELAAAAVKPVVIQLRKGETIVAAGERIQERHLVIFRALEAQASFGRVALSLLGGAIVAALLVAGLGRLSRRGRRPCLAQGRDVAVAGLLAIATLLGADLWFESAAALWESVPEVPFAAWAHLFPFAAVPLVLRMTLGAEVAVLFAVGVSLLVGLATGGSLAPSFVAIVGSLFACARAAEIRDRAGFFAAGATAGLVQAVAVVGLGISAGEFAPWETLGSAAAALVGGAVLVPVVSMALLFVLESGLGYLTDLRLVELSSLNHPALKELIVQAPGTYHHSIIVGTLVEAAAEAIGANPLLAKVCAYYHDLGKGKNPLYFAENQRGANPHDSLEPEESARIIVRHVEDGLAIARKYKLPKLVADAIPQHHGTRLVAYFYHRALRQQEGREDAPPVDPERFRYPGPRPQHREHALIMLADSVEAASRTLVDPTPERIEQMVRKLVQGIVLEGQLEECPLTLEDLSKIEKSFCRTLEAIYHSRPSYPAGVRESAALEGGREAPVVSLRR